MTNRGLNKTNRDISKTNSKAKTGHCKTNRGLQKKRRQIIEYLVPLMPSNRQTFGRNYKIRRKLSVYNHPFEFFFNQLFYFKLKLYKYDLYLNFLSL